MNFVVVVKEKMSMSCWIKNYVGLTSDSLTTLASLTLILHAVFCTHVWVPCCLSLWFDDTWHKLLYCYHDHLPRTQYIYYIIVMKRHYKTTSVFYNFNKHGVYWCSRLMQRASLASVDDMQLLHTVYSLRYLTAPLT